MLPTRFWELLAGTLLAFLEIRRGGPKQTALVTPLTLLGLALIVLSFVLFDEETRHPSLLTLAPIAGTCLIVWFARGADPVSKILGSRPFVALGLISYGLYMWHFPVFVFARLAAGDPPDNVDKLRWILLSIGLATLSYFTVEKPFRNRTRFPLRKLAPGLGGLVLPGLVFAAVAIGTSGLKGRFEELHRLYGPAQFDNALLQAESWSLIRGNGENSILSEPRPPQSAAVNVLITGDSHAKDTFNMFALNASLYPDFAFNRHPATVTPKDGSCFLDDTSYVSEFASSDLFSQSDVVLISERFRTKQSELDCLARYIRFLKKEGKKVVLTSLTNLYRREPLSTDNLDHFTRLFLDLNRSVFADNYILKRDKNSKTLANFERRLFELRKVDEIEQTNDALRRIAAEAGVVFLSKQDYQCDDLAKRCALLTPEGRKINYDASHYTLEGARYWGRKAASIDWLQLSETPKTSVP